MIHKPGHSEAERDPSELSNVALTLAIADDDTGSANSTALTTFLTTWAPEAPSFIRDSLANALLTDVDERQTFSCYGVHVQSLRATDGTILVITVDHR